MRIKCIIGLTRISIIGLIGLSEKAKSWCFDTKAATKNIAGNPIESASQLISHPAISLLLRSGWIFCSSGWISRLVGDRQSASNLLNPLSRFSHKLQQNQSLPRFEIHYLYITCHSYTSCCQVQLDVTYSNAQSVKHKVNENKICEIRQRIAHVIKSFAALLQALFPTA